MHQTVSHIHHECIKNIVEMEEKIPIDTFHQFIFHNGAFAGKKVTGSGLRAVSCSKIDARFRAALFPPLLPVIDGNEVFLEPYSTVTLSRSLKCHHLRGGKG